jgi:hypothetical protein
MFGFRLVRIIELVHINAYLPENLTLHNCGNISTEKNKREEKMIKENEQ